jgi:hypothetical protein
MLAGSPDPDALARLRCTAALLACTPTLSARLRWHERTVLEVLRPPHPVRDHAVLPPCWFRSFLSDAMRNGVPHELVEQQRFERILACAIDLGTRDGTVVLPGDVVRLEVGDAWMHLLAVSAGVDDVRPVVVDAAAALGDDGPGAAIGLHAARDLEVTVLSLGTHQQLEDSGEAAQALRDLAMAVAIERLGQVLDAAADHPARRREG